jgi:hypothetical protein
MSGPASVTEETLTSAVGRLCSEELRDKAQGICRGLSSLRGDDWASDLVARIVFYPRPGSSAESFRSWCEQLASWIYEARRTPTDRAAGPHYETWRYAYELFVFSYFIATVHEFLSGMTGNRFSNAQGDLEDPSSMEHLAIVRQEMALSPAAAERRLNEFRRCWNLDTLPPVTNMLAPPPQIRN